jgi:CPA2 family monovalent cation:H+ antiporter-2
MKVGGTASITAITQIINGIDGVFSGTMDGLETNGQHLLEYPLDFLHHNYSKTFEELGVKAQKFAGIVIGSHCSGYCSHLNDGSIIYRSKSKNFQESS